MRLKDRTEAYFNSFSRIEMEEVKSEFQLSYLIIIFFTIILCIASFNFFMMDDDVVASYGGTSTYITLVTFVIIFLAYQFFNIQYLKTRARSEFNVPVSYKFIHTIIEISFPSVITFYMIHKMNVISFLEVPVTLMYFLFIILSILHLDFRVNIFTGLLAAIQYTALTYYAFHYIDTPTSYSLSSENSHYMRAVILILSSGAAGFVSRELQTRIKSVLDFQQAKDELELLFGQQVSKEVSKALIEEKGVTKRLEATIMFLDIRNFTSFADAHTAEEVIDYQNKFLGPVLDIINQHQGVVFQILGDGLMACFGSPVENVLHTDMAFQSSIGIIHKINQLSEQEIIPTTAVGIGLHTGTILTGNIGNEHRKQFSVSGAPVIIASRIEQLN